VGPSDVAAWAQVLDRGGTIAALVAGIAFLLTVVLALGRLARWLLQQLLEREASERHYRESQLATVQSQLSRQADQIDRLLDQGDQQQKLFEQALRMLERGPRPA
jgi:hypothetical protein